MSQPTTVTDFFVASIHGVGHLYWPYSRETLCRRDKRHKATFSWAQWFVMGEPWCQECLLKMVDVQMEEIADKRGIEVEAA